MDGLPSTKKVVIVDCGTTYLRSLFDSLVEQGVFPIVVPHTARYDSIVEQVNPDAFIISGSRLSVNHKKSPRPDIGILNQIDTPVLGICYGMQYIVHALGGRVKTSASREQGTTKIHTSIAVNNKTQEVFTEDIISALNAESGADIFNGFDGSAIVWMSHVCKVSQLPEGFSVTSVSENTIISSIERGNLIGVQFHPEKRKETNKYTGNGDLILQNFIESI